MAGLVGGGMVGGMTGTTTALFTTTTLTSPTAEFSSITTTSTAAADFMAADFTAGHRPEDSAALSMDSRHLMGRLAPTPVHSAASTMEASRGVFPPAGSRASVEVPTAVEAFMAEEATAAEATGNSVQYCRRKR